MMCVPNSWGGALPGSPIRGLMVPPPGSLCRDIQDVRALVHVMMTATTTTTTAIMMMMGMISDMQMLTATMATMLLAGTVSTR